MEKDRKEEAKEEALAILNEFFNYEILDYIAEGGFGVVNKIEKDGHEYAVKIIEKRRYEQQWREKEFQDALRTELQILAALRDNPYVVDPPFQVMHTQKYWFLVQKLYKFGTLQEFMQKEVIDKGKFLSEGEIAFVLKQLLTAFREIHSLNIVHSDLKPQNILLHSTLQDMELDLAIKDFQIVLCDFGMAQILEKSNNYMTIFNGCTPLYLPPEVLIVEKDHKHSDKQPDIWISQSFDIWTLGIVAYLLKFHRYPFLNETLDEFITDESNQHLRDIKIDIENLRPHKEEEKEKFQEIFASKVLSKKLIIPNKDYWNQGVSQDFVNFLDKCFKFEMSQRAKAAELLFHSFIQKACHIESQGDQGVDELSYYLDEPCIEIDLEKEMEFRE